MRRDRLAARRKAMGFSQERLAQRLNVERTTVSRWETGESEPLPENMAGLKQVLAVTDAELEALLVPFEIDEQQTEAIASVIAALEAAPAVTAEGAQNRPVLRLLGHAHQALGDVAFDRLDLGIAADHYNQAHELGLELGDPT